MDELARAMERKESQDADATNFLAAIVDTKPLTSGSLPPEECARPGLHAFLEAVYPYYDSQSLLKLLVHDFASTLTLKDSLHMVANQLDLARD